MPVRRFRRSFRRRSARRRTAWSHETQSAAPATTLQSIDLLTDFKSAMGFTANPIGITIRRIRITIQIDFDLSTTAASRTAGVYLATYVDKGGLATAAVSNPVEEPNRDYNFRQWLPVSGGMGALSVGAATNATHQLVSREYDVKSMRRLLDIGDTLYFVARPTGGIGVGWNLEASTLLLLP